MISLNNICDLLKLIRTCEAINWGGNAELQSAAELWESSLTVYTFGGSGVPRMGVFTLADEKLVVVQGTTQALQWAQQVILSTLVPSLDTPGRVNSFYALAGHRLVTQLAGLSGAVTFCGHSLGGAMAMYLQSHFRQANPLCQCGVFGAPRAGDETFAASLLDTKLFWVRGDPIPLIPPALPAGYRHGGVALLIEGTSLQIDVSASWTPVVSKHYTSEYLARLQGMMGADQCDPPPVDLVQLNQQVAAVAALQDCNCA